MPARTPLRSPLVHKSVLQYRTTALTHPQQSLTHTDMPGLAFIHTRMHARARACTRTRSPRAKALAHAHTCANTYAHAHPYAQAHADTAVHLTPTRSRACIFTPTRDVCSPPPLQRARSLSLAASRRLKYLPAVVEMRAETDNWRFRHAAQIAPCPSCVVRLNTDSLSRSCFCWNRPTLLARHFRDVSIRKRASPFSQVKCWSTLLNHRCGHSI
eukprot:6179222-Pleurochrysis_carterae.AAC.1